MEFKIKDWLEWVFALFLWNIKVAEMFHSKLRI